MVECHARGRHACTDCEVVPVFYAYALLLTLSGVAMLVIAGIRRGRSNAWRAWNGIFGAGYASYGLYLLIFFRGGHYLLFLYAFLLPILMIVQFFRDRSAAQTRQAAAFQGP